MKLSGEDLSCYLSKIERVSLIENAILSLSCYQSDVTIANISERLGEVKFG